ncbi:hypothetical protein M5K25_010306 [Dendrobium thyrsiflorum]|uniref:Reverse transcriptase zinc-binding domain-containing protein n=1 Tax=Dendrobium thyrsiflorum TaxID=117978 RepID=A0ABD0V6R2_DENTH
MGYTETSNCNTLLSILHTFSNHSGLQLNLLKSSILLSPSISFDNSIPQALQINNISTKLIYLGIPITTGRIKVSDFSPLVDKITNLLSGWKARLLSSAGRTQFIKYTITNVVAYWMRGTCIPKTICKVINKICSRFLYFGSSSDKKLHMISWDNTCKPLVYGGLGIVSLQALRFAINCGLIYRLYNSNNPLALWLRARYGSPWKPNHMPCSAFWKTICCTAERARHKFKFQILPNSPISVFWDHWCLNDSILAMFPELLNDPHLKPNDTLAAWVSDIGWVPPSHLGHNTQSFIQSIPTHSEDSKHITWDYMNNASFKEFYNEFFVNMDHVTWHPLVWHSNYSLRFSVFTWMALLNGLKTADALLKRNIYIENNNCSLCHDFHDSTTHIFFECDYTYRVLCNLIPIFNCFFLRPNIPQAFEFIADSVSDSKIKNCFLLTLNAIIYHTWIERNNRRFKNTHSCAYTLSSKVKKVIFLKLDNWKHGRYIKEKLNLSYH